jgi:hypothetical protein
VERGQRAGERQQLGREQQRVDAERIVFERGHEQRKRWFLQQQRIEQQQWRQRRRK